MRKIRSKLTIAVAALALTLSICAFAAPAFADPTTSAGQLQNGVNAAAGQSGSNDAVGTVNNTITSVINILSVLVGIIAVIMIIVGGYRYITSGGDSAKVTSAKNTLLYAIIGLIIVALAQVIAQFVISKATQDGTSSTTNQTNQRIGGGPGERPN